MGSQRRYAEGNARRRFNREAEALALSPRSLSEAELGRDAVHRGPSTPVRAWFDFGNISVQVMGYAVAWTTKAVLVLWVDSFDQRHEIWVWSGAVDRAER